MHHTFSYLEYRSIIQHLTSFLPIMDFSEVDANNKEYCVIRHDIEFSVDRALELAKYEKESLNIQSSYLFQLRNNCYNLVSDTNIEKLQAISNMGHKVGLHYHLDSLSHMDEVEDSILTEADFFARLTGIKVDRFSFHRPPQPLLKQYIKVEGLINCYDSRFFEYYETPHDQLEVKYFTDSRHQWNHGHPLDNKHSKVQLLTHPYSWSPQGANNLDNYKNLLQEKSLELRQSINHETSTFPPELLYT